MAKQVQKNNPIKFPTLNIYPITPPHTQISTQQKKFINTINKPKPKQQKIANTTFNNTPTQKETRKQNKLKQKSNNTITMA